MLSHPIPSIMLIGAQKCGTESIFRTISDITEMRAMLSETHYFDHCSITDPPYSYNYSLYQFWNISKCSHKEFKRLLIRRKIRRRDRNSSYMNSIYILEKTPVNILVPHIAEIVMNKLVRYGSKIFVLLRDPTKRLISGLWQWFTQTDTKELLKNNTDNELNEYINKYICIWTAWASYSIYCEERYNITIYEHIGVKMKEFNSDLDRLYNQYINGSFNDNNNNNMLMRVGQIYCNIYYWIQNNYPSQEIEWADYRSWLRGYYSGQIINWLYRMNNLGLKHSFKIIQFELLFLNHYSFKKTLLYLRCYIHSVDIDDIDYNEWMKKCGDLENSSLMMNFFKYHKNSKTKHIQKLPQFLQEMLKESYKVSNKWLELVIDKMYPNILLNEWNFTMWNIG